MGNRKLPYILGLLCVCALNTQAQVLIYRFTGRVQNIGQGNDTRTAVSGLMLFDYLTSTGYHITQTRIGTTRYFAIRDLDAMDIWRAIGRNRHHVILTEQDPNRHVIAIGTSTILRTSTGGTLQYPRTFQLTGTTLGGASEGNADYSKTTVTYSYSTKYSVLANDFQLTAEDLMEEARLLLMEGGAIEQ